MGLSLHPERLMRYRDVARLLFKMNVEVIDEGAFIEGLQFFFLGAASGGVWLAFDILRSDRPPTRRP